ncbi:hypothetical protein HDU91_006610 [Kappamyces sp. JEL0680]|nr:hypothetical protein HDU91_006610 [Kappamyces sp. JEL0680]
MSPRMPKQGLAGSSSSLNSAGSKKGNVFDRLTDTKLYTGTHKERFDEFGNGRGLAGRDPGLKGSGTNTIYRGGNVTSLSQILRQ